MKNKELLLSLVACVISVLLLSSAALAERRQITVWTITSNFDELVVNSFNKQSDDVVVKHEYVPGWDALLEKLTAALAGGNPPDVAIVDHMHIGRFVVTDKVVPLDKYIQRPGGVEISDFFPAFLEVAVLDGTYWGRFAGKTWALPHIGNDIILFYNKRLFAEAGLKEPPNNWDEMVQYAQKMTNRPKGQWGLEIPFFAGYFEETSWDWQTFLYQAGGKFLDLDKKESYVNSDAGVEALQFWVDLVHKYRVTPLKSAEQAFVRGKIGMIVAGSWMNTLREWGYPRGMKDDVGSAILPERKTRATNIGGHWIVMFRSTPERQEAAWKFIEYLKRPEVEAKCAVDDGALPVSRTATETEEWKSFVRLIPTIEPAVASVEYGRTRPSISKYFEISKEITNTVQKAIYRQGTPKELLDALDKFIEEVLNRQ